MSKHSSDYDAAKSYSQGVDDGKTNDFNPPHEKGLIGELFSGGYTKDEHRDRDAYREGWDRGSKSR